MDLGRYRQLERILAAAQARMWIRVIISFSRSRDNNAMRGSVAFENGVPNYIGRTCMSFPLFRRAIAILLREAMFRFQKPLYAEEIKT
jgi:hypothetical protein